MPDKEINPWTYAEFRGKAVVIRIKQFPALNGTLDHAIMKVDFLYADGSGVLVRSNPQKTRFIPYSNIIDIETA